MLYRRYGYKYNTNNTCNTIQVEHRFIKKNKNVEGTTQHHTCL